MIRYARTTKHHTIKMSDELHSLTEPRVYRRIYGPEYEANPYRLPYYHLNIKTGKLQMIRGNRCDRRHTLTIPDPETLYNLKETDAKAYGIELDRIYNPHRESGAFAHLYQSSVRICTFCRTRKGRKIEALRSCKCFDLETCDNVPDFLIKLETEQIEVPDEFSHDEPDDETKSKIVDVAIRCGYIPRSKTLYRNYDQLAHLINTRQYLHSGFGPSIVFAYAIIISDIEERRNVRKMFTVKILNAKLTQCGYFRTKVETAAGAAAFLW